MQWQSLVTFNRFLDKIKAAQDDAQIRRAAADDYLAELAAGNGPLAQSADVSDYLRKNWPLLKDRLALKAADTGMTDAATYLLKAVAGDISDDVPLSRWAKNLVVWMEKFVEEINKFLVQIAPDRFIHRGLKVFNPDRLPESAVKRLLTGVDYLTDLFKRRGASKVLSTALDRVTVRHPTLEDKNAHGFYHPNPSGGSITVLVNATHARPRVLQDWVHEVFLHEIAHHIHLHLLHPEAKAEWDSGWDPVSLAAAKAESVRRVSHSERTRFWQMLVGSKGDLKRIRLKGLDRMKFHAWLTEPLVGSPLVTAKRLQWSKDGQYTYRFLKDPDSAVRDDSGADTPDEVARKVADRWRRLTSNMGVSQRYVNDAHPILSVEQIQEYAEDDAQVERAIDALEVPTAYARTNLKEDFAETFVYFMEAPESLSEQARYRMRRALHLSDLAGTPILKAKRLNAALRALNAAIGMTGA